MRTKKDEKILIIKLGYTETLDSNLSLTTSLGDVLRTTVILHFFKKSHIVWLSAKEAMPLLQGNVYLDRILIYNSHTIKKLRKEHFDVVINLEKLPEVRIFCDSLHSDRFLGFSSRCSNNVAERFPASNIRMDELIHNLNKRKRNKSCWQEVLAGIVGKRWNGEEYVLGYNPKSNIKYDVGFNWTTGNKWMNKAWPKTHWKRLEGLIGNRYLISWQRGMNNLHEYIDWINSCKLIVTADTLGLHIGLALRKKIVALFGPTSPYEIYSYDCGSYVTPQVSYDCMPCFKLHCEKERQCMEFITPEEVKEIIDGKFKENNCSGEV